MKKSLTTILLALAALCLMGVPAAACEPIPQFMLATQSTQVWSAFALRSGLALLLIVVFKGLLFFYKSDLPFIKAMGFMFIANIFSTIPGLLGAIAGAGGSATLIFGPVALILAFYYPAKSLKRHHKLRNMSVSAVVIAMVLLTMFSTTMFYSASNSYFDSIPFYFAIKLAFMLVAVSSGLLVSIGYEEAVIHFFQRKKNPDGNYIDAVAWANVYAMLIFMAIGAAIALPKRLDDPNFLMTAQRILSDLIATIQAHI